MIDLYKLKIFQTAAQEGSLTAAAERMQLQQPGVSQHIKDLEATLGATLFERGRRGVTLTTAGQVLLDYTHCIFKMLDEAETAVTQVGQLTKTELHIGATEEIGIYVMPGWLGEFHQRYQNLRVKLHTTDGLAIKRQVKAGELDLGFIDSETPAGARVASVYLQDVTLRVIVHPRHQWVERETVAIEELAAQPFIIDGRNELPWLTVDLDVVASFNSLEAIKKAVSNGMGIAMVPACTIAPELATGQLHSLTVSDVVPKRYLSAIWANRSALSPVAKAFLIYLAEEFPQLAKVISTEDLIETPEVVTLPDTFNCLSENIIT